MNTQSPADSAFVDALAEAPWRLVREAFSNGSDTPSDFLERSLRTIKRRDPTVRAFVTINEASSRAEAAASTRRWREGRPQSPIDGMPVAIKDLLETKDMPTQMGCRAFDGHFPRRDNAAVLALRNAGAVILGKTVTAELGNTQPGPTTNPFDEARTPGGSSSGSAAAVGAGMVPAAIGTQVGGSIIRPASFCGNWALKPSQGAINRGDRQATSMSTHGAHALEPEAMWSVMTAIARRVGGDPGRHALMGPDSLPAARQPEHLVFVETPGWRDTDAQTRSIFNEGLAALASEGVRLRTRADDPHVELLERGLVGSDLLANEITAWENHWALRWIVEQHPDGVSARGRRTLDIASAVGVEGYEARIRVRTELRRLFAEALGGNGIMITLSSPGPAPVWAGDVEGGPLDPFPTGNPVFNVPASLCGAPALTVPLLRVGGLPVGVQLVGAPGCDAKVVAVGLWLAQALRPRVS